jgi:hypothetical protein
VDDNGANVSKFDEDGDAIAVVSERNWTVALQAREGLAELPKRFRFGAAKAAAAEMVYQRFQDADVQAAAPEIALEREYGRRDWGWQPWAVAAGVGFLGVAGAAAYLGLRRRRAPAGTALPGTLTPFTVLSFLTRVRAAGKLSDHQRAELDQCIAVLEAHYFAAPTNGHNPDLRQVAERWLFAAEAQAPPRR